MAVEEWLREDTQETRHLRCRRSFGDCTMPEPLGEVPPVATVRVNAADVLRNVWLRKFMRVLDIPVLPLSLVELRP